MISKKHIRLFVKSAKEIINKTDGLDIVYNIYADSCFALDNEEDNIIDVMPNEESAIETVRAINSGEFSDDGRKSNCYYKPSIIDANSGIVVTRETIKQYLKPAYKNWL